MLVLTRRRSERIFVGDNIIIKICEIRGDEVRIGIEAPRSILILRDNVEPYPRPGRADKLDDGPCHPEAVG